MGGISRASGITVSVDGPARLAREAASLKRSARPPGQPSPKQGVATDLFVAALREQEFELVDSIPLQIPLAARPRRRGASAPVSAVTLDVPLGRGEQAVVLVEDEGEYRWIVEGEPLPTPPALSKRGRGKGAAEGRQLRFSIELKAAPPPPRSAAKRRATKRSWLAEQLVGRVTAYVFRFAFKLAGKKLVKYLESGAAQGLIAITSLDPQSWTLLGKDDALPFELPPERPARVLLFVHGTFSSTVGSFGALGASVKGADFIRRALQAYDAVLGFDHATLSIDPRKNASDLLARLRRVKWPQAPQIDIVAFSRGGLVARSLVENLLPASPWRVSIGRVVFVGCTNGGTELAEPANWHRFADHYTNLALGAARALSLIPGAQGWTTIARQAVRGVGTLVKALATGVVTDKVAPGIAAMEPDGEFVSDINRALPRKPPAAAARYYAITSDFEPSKALKGLTTPELPPKLLLRVANWGADELYGEANDLVVHVRSMTEIGPKPGAYVKGTLDYGSNGVVYHTNYFAQDRTANQLVEWFDLPTFRGKRGGTKGTAPGRGTIAKGVRATLFDDILEAHYEAILYRSTVATAAPVAPKRSGKSPVVDPAKLYLPKLVVKKAAAPKKTALPKKAAALGKAAPFPAPAPARKKAAPAKKPVAKKAAAKPAAKPVAKPVAKKSAVPRKAARGNPVTSQPLGNAARVSESARVECYFRAAMDREVVVDKEVSVDVTIARHMLEEALGRASDIATGQVEPGKKLIVQVSERRNFRVSGERRVEIDIPKGDEEANVSFDVVGLVADSDGELWVQVRQGPVPLVTLKLKPRIVAKRSAGPTLRLSAEYDLAAFPPDEAPLDQLLIEESFVGADVQYRYFFDLPSLRIRKHFESPVLQGRDTYITKIMNRIGDAWAGTGHDQVEAFEVDLKSIGAMMFRELMPREMQELLWDNRARIGSVQVFSMEPFIPWELVCMKDPKAATVGEGSMFLGELGLVRWLYDSYPPSRLMLGRGRARYIIPAYTGALALPEAAKEEKLLRRLFAAKAVPARARDVQKLLATPGSFDLLHFGGHGEAAGTELADARLLLEQSGAGSTENALLATTVDETAQLNAEGRQPIVVLNACESARMSRTFAGMGGFAKAFVSRGAGVFVGTHWSVGDSPARTFIEAFYEAFAVPKDNAKPVELSEAVRRARQAARNAGDATWLAYVVYGHPRSVVMTD